MQTVQAILTSLHILKRQQCLFVCLFVRLYVCSSHPIGRLAGPIAMPDGGSTGRPIGRLSEPPDPAAGGAISAPGDARASGPRPGSGRSPRTQTPSAVGGIPFPRPWGESAQNSGYVAGGRQEKTTPDTGDGS